MRRTKNDANRFVYRYWVKPKGEVPRELWETARKMQQFWNVLVQLREDAGFNADTLPEDREAIFKCFWNLLAGRDAEFKQWRSHVKDGSGLNWEARDAVFDRFVTACQQAATGKRGWPKSQRRFERIAVPHRFTNGGLEVQSLFGERAWRFRLEPVSEWAYQGKTRRHTNARLTGGIFGLSKDVQIGFTTVLHRPLPTDALIKGVTWLGELHAVKGWQWAIAVSLETKRLIDDRPNLPAAAIDLGWRTMGDYIRIGMLADSDGNIVELRFPLEASTYHSRRHGIVSGWRDLLAIDRTISLLVEDVKAKVYAHFTKLDNLLPEEIKAMAGGLARARQGGLVRLLRGLQEQQFCAAAQSDLKTWLVENDRMRSVRSALQDRLIHRRQWLYRNLSAFVARRYGAIAIEGDLRIKEMIEREQGPEEYALDAARRYHQWAAVAELKGYIEQAAVKYGSQLIKQKAAWTTRTCHVCREQAEGGAARELTCPRGHRWDQDVNAAVNLLGTLTKGEPLKDRLRQPLRLQIPTILRQGLSPEKWSLHNAA
jgi:hypothetical protein